MNSPLKRIEKILQHKTVIENKGLNKQIRGLRNQIIKSDKVATKYAQMISLMSDGMEYDEALREVNFNNY